MIEAGKNVSLNYELRVDGQVVDKSGENEPFRYVHGEGSIIPGFEKGLEGLEVGDKKTIVVPSKEAYGDRNPQAVIEIPKDQFPDPNIKVGMGVSSKTPDGKALRGAVKEVREKKVVVDFNHPLAGKELTFSVTIREIA